MLSHMIIVGSFCFALRSHSNFSNHASFVAPLDSTIYFDSIDNLAIYSCFLDLYAVDLDPNIITYPILNFHLSRYKLWSIFINPSILLLSLYLYHIPNSCIYLRYLTNFMVD